MSERLLTIGAVLAALREEFPDVTVSKIRFLEAEGLVTPQRTPKGYRQFASDDVERLRFVLRAQRDHFWPLKVIRESLEAMDRGLEPVGPGDSRPRPPTPPPDADVPTGAELGEQVSGMAARSVRVSRAELRDASGLADDDVAELVGFGLLHPDGDGWFGEGDLVVAAAAAGLAAYGIEARHLRPFRIAADREVGLVEQALAGTRADDDRLARAGEVAHLCLRLHAALLKGGLARG